MQTVALSSMEVEKSEDREALTSGPLAQVKTLPLLSENRLAQTSTRRREFWCWSIHFGDFSAAFAASLVSRARIAIGGSVTARAHAPISVDAYAALRRRSATSERTRGSSRTQRVKAVTVLAK